MPVSSNHAYVYRGGGAILNERAREWMFSAETIIMCEMEKQKWKTVIDEKVIVEVTHWWPDKRCRDSHNSYKILLDSLENSGVFSNDRYALVRQGDFFIDRENPRIELVIYRQADEPPLSRCHWCKYSRGVSDDGVDCIVGKYIARHKRDIVTCKEYKERGMSKI